MPNIQFSIISLIYITILTFLFFTKKRIKTVENKIYGIMLIISIITICVDIISVYTIVYRSYIPIINLFITKLYIILLLLWISIFSVYISLVCTNKEKNEGLFLQKNNIILYLCIIFFLIGTIVIIVSPIEYYCEANKIYSYGICSLVDYISILFYSIVMVTCIIKHRNSLNVKKLIPLIAYIIVGTIVAFIQFYKPEILLMSSLGSVVTFLMYFTIENPDLKMIEELNLARAEAEKANNAKSEFLANMSHEIRTPLNAITGFAQALADEEDMPTAAKEDIKDIMMASNSLLEIVNGVLDISKIEAGKLEIIDKEYEIRKVFDELIILTKARIGEKPIEFKSCIDLQIPPVLYGDHVRVKQIVLNLLTNSAKYTNEGFIELKVDSVIKDDVCRLIISVEDSGIGIEENKIDKLFTKFERFDEEKNITIEGTGLGLAITKKLVELMNGKIVVQSKYGEGSKFTVAIDQKIVVGKTCLDNKKENRKRQIVNNSSDDIEVLDSDSDSNNETKKILVVDDNKLNLKVALRLLKPYGFDIEEVDSGFLCLDKIKEGNKYDLILLDDMMPKMSGVETLQKLKEIDGFNIKTVALTANALSGMREQYIAKGFDDYLAKPIEKSELEKIIDKYL